MAIHSQRHGVCDGKRENHPVPPGGGGGGFSSPPGPHAQWETTKPQEAEHKTAAVGEGDAAEQRDILFHRGGGAGRIHHDVHYLLKYKST